MRELFSLFLFSSCVTVLAGYRSYNGYKVYNVYPESSDDVALLRKLENVYDFWQHPRLSRKGQIMVAPHQELAFRKFVEDSHIRSDLFIEDLGPHIAKQTDYMENRLPAPPGTREYYETYHTLEEIHNWMFEIAANYSHLVSIFEVGKSYEGRPIYTFLISTGGGGEKPAVWFDGGIHAREWVSPASVQYFTYQLLSNYGVDDTVTALLDGLDWYSLPVFNVDGYDFTWTDDRMWRKTRSPNAGSPCIGTDPNRNWDVEWGTVGISHDPCSNSYCGSAPFSEVEVSSVASYIENDPRIMGYFAYHSYGQMYMTPYGYTTEPPPDFDKLIEACNTAIAALEAVHGSQYVCDALINLVGESSGSSADYTYEILGITWSYGVELRDQGEYGFLLPEDQILPTAEENYAALLEFGQSILADVTP